MAFETVCKRSRLKMCIFKLSIFEIHLATLLPDVLCHFSGCSSISTVTLPADPAGGAAGAGLLHQGGGVALAPSTSLNLQFLDLTDCVRLMDAGLHLIAKNSPHLRQLYLRRCINITGKIYYHCLMMLFVCCHLVFSGRPNTLGKNVFWNYIKSFSLFAQKHWVWNIGVFC